MFEGLAETTIPEIVGSGKSDVPIRIWVAGCATGEEAYSLAVLFKEACLRAECTRSITIFATDIDDRAILFARTGLYSDVIEASISIERLDHHFVKEGHRYRVAKHIRDMCVFSVHDLVKDPPFSKLDMISCRNLLIYFEAGLQQRVLSTFHYGLKSRGKLWLGPSETIANRTKLFKTIEKRCRLFERIDAAVMVPNPVPNRSVRQANAHAVVTPGNEIDLQAARILAQYAPAFVILDGQNEVQRFSGPIARFLEPVSGGASLNLFRLLHAELRGPARTLVKRASEGGIAVQEQVSFRVDGHNEMVNMIAEPLTEPSGGKRGLLLAFQEVLQPKPSALSASFQYETSPPREGNQNELMEAREKLQTVTEELETANEELQSSNEEFQSVNEELHSTVEELETSKEELQSINEELQTVNAELSNRAESLVRSNSDLANLFDSTAIATLFLDNELRIRRFTPAISDIFNVREGDEGRPITDFASRLGEDVLAPDAKLVLRDLRSVEREVNSDDGNSSYLLCIKPYRSLNNVIDGVSVTLVDITERKSLDKARAHLAAIVDSSEDAIISHDLDGLITSWNTGARKIYGYTADEIVGKPMSILLASDQVDEWPTNLAKLRRGESIMNFDISRTTKDDRAIHLSLMISPICDEKGRIVGASAVARDIAERKVAEERALMLMAELDHRVKNILAIVSSVVTQTLRSSGPPEAFSAEIEGRIMAIARAHNLMTDHGGTNGSMRDLIATELRPYDHNNNINLTGPDVALTSNASVTLALAIHELATNAAKYGCLSIPNGQLNVVWRLVGDGNPQQLELEWREAGGPPVTAPSRRGFGTKLIEVSLARGLGAKVDRVFNEKGVHCLIVMPFKTEVGTIKAVDLPAERSS